MKLRYALTIAALVVFVSPGPGARAASPIDVCGPFSALSPGGIGQPARLVIGATTYTLVGPGTVTPPDISSRVGLLTHPIVRLTGTAEGTTVTSYQVTQVAACALPNTSTAG